MMMAADRGRKRGGRMKLRSGSPAYKEFPTMQYHEIMQLYNKTKRNLRAIRWVVDDVFLSEPRTRGTLVVVPNGLVSCLV